MTEPRRIWWARRRKLCALERPGGGGRSHRPKRRAEEIDYLKDAGVRLIVSCMATRHNLRAYDEAGIAWVHLPVEETEEGLAEVVAVLRRELRKRGAVAIHANRRTDFVAAACAAWLDWEHGAHPEDALEMALQAGMTVTPEAAALVEADPDWIAGLLEAA